MSNRKKATLERPRALISQNLQNLRNMRESLGLTQEEAERAISAEFYARIERGNAIPSRATLVGVAQALSVAADRLLGPPTRPVSTSD